MAGNTAFVDALCDARSRTPAAGALPVFCASLRTAEPGAAATRCGGADALVVTVLAAGGTQPGRRVGGRRRRGLGRRRARRAGRADPAGAVPDQQPREPWADSDDGLSPAGRRHPGRDPRVRRPAHHRAVLVQGDRRGRAARLRRRPRARRPGRRASRSRTPGCGTSRRASERIALMLSAYPTKHARVGNAVGLDTPASAVRAAAPRCATRATTSATPASCPGVAARRRRRADPRADRGRRPGRGLAHRGAARRQPGPDPRRRLPRLVRRRCPRTCATRVEEHWGPAPGELFVDRSGPDGDIVLAALRAGNVRACMIQPPRGFGENPVAIYHDPDLPPVAPLPGRLPLAARDGSSARTRSCTSASTATWSGCPARPSGLSAACGPTPRSATCRWSTRSWSTTPARAPRPSAARTPRSSTTSCRRWPAPRPTATSPGWSSCSTSTPTSPRWTRPSCPRSARRSGR